MTKFALKNLEEIATFLEYLAIASPGKPLGLQSLQEIASRFADVDRHRVGLALNVLKRRKTNLGHLYPFEVQDEYLLLESSMRESFYYLFLCLSSESPIARSPQFGEGEAAEIFEHLTEQCFSEFFGSGSGTLNFGFNSEPDRPSDFDGAVRWAANKMGVQVGAGYRQPRRKDGGVDLFVWKSFSDGNPGLILMLLQCTVMADYVNKISDIDKRLWASWLSSDIDPVLGLAVPMLVHDSASWNEINIRGLLFDRARLSKLATKPANLRPAESAYFTSFEGRIASYFHQ